LSPQTLSHLLICNDIDFSTSAIISNRSDLDSLFVQSRCNEQKAHNELDEIHSAINAFGSFEYNDTKAFGTNADNWMIGLNLQWIVFNGFQNIASIQKSKAELNHAKLNLAKAKSKSKNEIDAAIRDLKTAKKKLHLAETSVDQSEESLRIIKDQL
jgi:outer membrane protein